MRGTFINYDLEVDFGCISGSRRVANALCRTREYESYPIKMADDEDDGYLPNTFSVVCHPLSPWVLGPFR
jgi:hypothetical protein